jgi:hypothetical protein
MSVGFATTRQPSKLLKAYASSTPVAEEALRPLSSLWACRTFLMHAAVHQSLGRLDSHRMREGQAKFRMVLFSRRVVTCNNANPQQLLASPIIPKAALLRPNAWPGTRCHMDVCPVQLTTEWFSEPEIRMELSTQNCCGAMFPMYLGESLVLSTPHVGPRRLPATPNFANEYL